MALTPLIAKSLNIATDGSNAFSKIRFAVPYLCGFQGQALWVDGADMCLRRDLRGLWSHRQSWYGCQVVKHSYKPANRKYIGTELEAENADYPRKNWSSLILWDCVHYMNRKLTPEFIRESTGQYLQRFAWLPDDRIGELPKEWNHLVGEQEFDPAAKIAHHTLGLPGFEYYRTVDYAEEWTNTLKAAARGLQASGVSALAKG